MQRPGWPTLRYTQVQDRDAFEDDGEEEEQPPTEYDEDGVLTTSLHSFADLRIIINMASSMPGSGTGALLSRSESQHRGATHACEPFGGALSYGLLLYALSDMDIKGLTTALQALDHASLPHLHLAGSPTNPVLEVAKRCTELQAQRRGGGINPSMLLMQNSQDRLGWMWRASLVACRPHLLSMVCSQIGEDQSVQSLEDQIAGLSAAAWKDKSSRHLPEHSAASIMLTSASPHRWRLTAQSFRQLSNRRLSRCPLSAALHISLPNQRRGL